MIKEVRENIASMYSLMERMDKHMTSFEAEYNKNEFLNEAFNEGLNQGHLKPVANMSITEDASIHRRKIVITIRPLYDQDVAAIKRTAPYSMDDKCQKTKDGHGIAFYKLVPLKEKRVKADAQNADAQAADNQQADATAQQTQAQPQVAQAPKKGGLLGKLAAKKAAQAQNDGSDNNVVTEGLLSKLGAKANNGAAAQAPAATAPAQTNAPAGAPQVQADSDDVLKWLKTYYLGIVNIIAKNTSYDQQAIDKLKDIQSLYNVYRAEPTSYDKIYVEKSSNDMKSEIAKSIAQGNWADVLKANINPLNLESLIFGNVLTIRNQNAVKNKAREEGINPGDPNYPTLVMAPGKWAKFMRREIIDNPRVAYPMVAPRITDPGHIKQGSGTKGHYDSFGTNNSGFQYFLGYDITDTQPIDPSDTTDYVNGLPGILNNLTGELNQAAIDFKDAALAAKQANLSDEQKQALADAQTTDGQARIFNGALMSYAEQYKLQVSLADASNSPTPINDYVANVLKITKQAVALAGYSNPSIADPMSIIAAFGVGCYTIASDEILKYGNSTSRNGVQSLKGDWDKYADSVISTISSIIRYIYNYLNAVYNPINGGSDSADPNLVVVATPSDAQQAQATPINESKDVYSTIEDIIENL